jgi:hypothetical protein
VALAVAVLLPVLIGFAGIGVEVGMWFWVQRQNQSAADAAAISAALEYAAQIQSNVGTNPAAAAATTANYNLFSTSPPNTLTLYRCYGFTVGNACNTSTGNGLLNAVQVVLTQPLNTTFASFVTAIWGPSLDIVNVTTSAIAAFPMLTNGQTCLLGVGSGNPPTGTVFSTSGGVTLNLPKCALASLSTSGNSIQLSTSADINAGAIATAGNILVSDGTMPPHTHTYFPLLDPYKSVTAIPLSGTIPTGSCSGLATISSGTVTVPPAPLYCGLTVNGTANVTLPTKYYIGPEGLTIGGSAQVTLSGGIYYIGGNIYINGSPTVTFRPGLYYIYGGSFSIDNLTGGSVSGSEITFVLTASSGGPAGGINIDPNACSGISLSGPKTAQGLLQPSPTASQGLLFFQDPTAGGPSTPNIITTGTSNNGCAATLNGAVYTPKSADNIQGNALAGATGCTEFIFQSFTFTGNPLIDDTGCKSVDITLNQAQIQQVYLAM